jgi:hypothetical protein
VPPSSPRKRRQLQIVAVVVAVAMVLSLLVSFVRVLTSEPQSVGPGDPSSLAPTAEIGSPAETTVNGV